MNLIPWRRRNSVTVRRGEPVGREGGSLQQELERAFDRMWHRSFDLLAGDLFERLVPVPSVDVADHRKEIVITAEVPGMTGDDVEIAVEDRILTISGEKKHEEERQEGDLFHAERRFGRFMRSIELPAEADVDSIEATEQNGVLTIRIAKSGPANTRRVEVKRARQLAAV